MNINISTSSSVPLYEQIQNQIRASIVSGELTPSEALPSIRVMAKELKVSIITSKRAYEELEKEGFIQTIAGKGTFVSSKSTERLKEIALYEIECRVRELIKEAKAVNMNLDDWVEISKSFFEEE